MVSVKIEKIVEILEELLNRKWGLGVGDWCLAGEYALLAQNYPLKMRTRDIDVGVIAEKLPWQVEKRKDERRRVLPPKDSSYFDDYVKFIEETGLGLDLIPLPGGFYPTIDSLKKSSVVITLVNQREIRTNTAVAEAKIHDWLLKKFSSGAGEESTQRWWRYIKDIKQAAEKRRDKRAVEACNKILKV